jgi:hypothetical protein
MRSNQRQAGKKTYEKRVCGAAVGVSTFALPTLRPDSVRPRHAQVNIASTSAVLLAMLQLQLRQ